MKLENVMADSLPNYLSATPLPPLPIPIPKVNLVGDFFTLRGSQISRLAVYNGPPVSRPDQ